MDALNGFATGGLAPVISFIGNFLALIILSGLLFAFAMKIGRGAFIALIMALYAGFALFSVFPFAKALTGGGSATVAFVVNLIVFDAFVFFSFLLIRRITTSGMIHIHPVVLFGLAFLASGLILAIGYHTFALASVIPLSPSLDALFAPAQYFFWWFVAPLAGLFLFAR